MTNGEFYCAVKGFKCIEDYNIERKEILSAFNKGNILETLQTIELYYGNKSFSLKDIPIDRRKTILENMIISKLYKASQTYNDLYESLLNPISYLNDLGMDIPEGFRVCAKYTLLDKLEKNLLTLEKYTNKEQIKKLEEIKKLADKFYIKLNNSKAKDILSAKLLLLVQNLKNEVSLSATKELLAFFELLEKLDIQTKIDLAQNIFYSLVCADFDSFALKIQKKPDSRILFLNFVEIGRKLNINMDFYAQKIDKITGKL